MAILLKGLNFDQAVDYHYGNFPPEEFDYARLINPLARATEAIARFDQMLQSLDNSEIILAPLRVQEAVISSRMDGNECSVDDILAYGADFESGTESLLQTNQDVAEAYLYQRALHSAQTSVEDGQPITKFLLKALHLLSFKKGASTDPGKFKSKQNYLTDHTGKKVLYVPISPERLEDGMHALFKYIETEEQQALLKLAVSHLELEALRPFKGGNGRIGRMLIALMLWSAGIVSTPHFYISRYLEEHRDIYFDSMRNVSAEGDWTGWCEFFLTALESQAKHHMLLTENICGLYEKMKKEFTDILSSKWSDYALDYIFTHPVFRNNRFTHGAQIPRSSAARFTQKLSDKKLLSRVENSSGRRAGLYSFEPLVQLIRV